MSGIGILTESDQQVIENYLKDFLGKSEAQWTALVDRGGNLYSEVGDIGTLDMSILSALAAGSFSATKELAKRLGEQEFMALYHEGLHVSILMVSLYADCLLLTVFGERTNIGLVRFYAQQVAVALNHCLTQAGQSAVMANPLVVDAEFSGQNPIIG